MNLGVCFLILFTAIQNIDTELYRAIVRDNSVAAGNLHPYFAPEEENAKKLDTKAPKGYEPFYFSYYGRHGSRHLTGKINFISDYVAVLDTLSAKSALTEKGELLKKKMHWIEDEHKGNMSMLTSSGFKEEQGISRRFAKRYGRIFRQRSRNSVIYRSSPALRSALTGASFMMELCRKFPKLDFDVLAGERYYYTKWDPCPEVDASEKRIGDSLRRACFDTSAFCAKFFKDETMLRKALSGKSLGKAQYEIMHILSLSKCLDPEAEPFDLFNTEEIYAYAIVQNAHTAAWFIHSKETGIYRDTNAGAHLINEIIARADEAVEGNGVCADLRFGHDSGVAPLFSFLGIEGYDKCTSLADTYISWPAYKHVAMGCNFAMILYRNRKGDILVKILENEKETAIPAISPFSGPYYRWSDFRDYCSRKI